jgi:hypothetical protein
MRDPLKNVFSYYTSVSSVVNLCMKISPQRAQRYTEVGFSEIT